MENIYFFQRANNKLILKLPLEGQVLWNNVSKAQMVWKLSTMKRYLKLHFHIIMRNKHGFTSKLFPFIFACKSYHSFITYIKQQSISRAMWLPVPKQICSNYNLFSIKMIHIYLYLKKYCIPENKENEQFFNGSA